MEEQENKNQLLDELHDVKSDVKELMWSVSDLISSIEELEIQRFQEKDAKVLLEGYKRDLESQGLWTKELDEHLDMFIKFDLSKYLQTHL